jgi:uncharacterized protein (DUF736 family)
MRTSDGQLDFSVPSQGIEIGAGWFKTDETSAKKFIILSIVAP